MGTYAARKNRVAIVQQVLRRDGGRNALTRLDDELNRACRRDVLEDDRQCGKALEQRREVDAGRLFLEAATRLQEVGVAAYEVLVATSAVRNLIKESKTHQLRNSLVTGAQDGMITLEQSLSMLVQQGRVTYDDAIARSLYPKDVEARPRLSAARVTG